MEQKLVIAIPSYKRVEVLRDNTLQYLQDCGITIVPDVFVSNAEEAEKYRQIPSINVVYEKDLNTLGQKFNFINMYYPKGTWVLCMEDDIEGMYKKRKDKPSKTKKFLGFENVARKMFALSEKVGTKLWGFNPADNGFYQSFKITDHLICVPSFCFGFISTQDPFFNIKCSWKTDWERTIRYYIKFNKILRVNYIGPKTQSFQTKGGLNALATKQRAALEERGKEYMLLRYPHFVTSFVRKNVSDSYAFKGFDTELRMARIKQPDTNDWEQYQIMYERGIDLSPFDNLDTEL